MAKKWTYQVGLSYTGNISTLIDKMIDAIASKYNGVRDGSGGGMGMRDIDYVFEHKMDAYAFLSVIKKDYKHIVRNVFISKLDYDD